jgi:hypothetical protein
MHALEKNNNKKTNQKIKQNYITKLICNTFDLSTLSLSKTTALILHLQNIRQLEQQNTFL